jgi:hypothetical protein
MKHKKDNSPKEEKDLAREQAEREKPQQQKREMHNIVVI